MLKLNKDQAEAVFRLNQHEDFRTFLALVRNALTEGDAANRKLVDVVQLHQSQGRCQAFAAILEVEQSAKRILEAVKRPPPV